MNLPQNKKLDIPIHSYNHGVIQNYQHYFIHLYIGRYRYVGMQASEVKQKENKELSANTLEILNIFFLAKKP